MRRIGVPFALALALLALWLGARREVYAPGELEPPERSLGGDEQSIVLVGDIMTWDRTAAPLAEFGVDYPFLATAPLLRGADLTVGNLEGPIAEQAELRPGKFRYRVPPWTLQGLVRAGFDLVSLANNHVTDCGPAGVIETLTNLERARIKGFGAGRTRAEAERPAVLRVGQTRVAWVAAVAAETTIYEWRGPIDPREASRRERAARGELGAGPARPGAAIASADRIERMVRRARRLGDLVVLFIHWGVRYRREPTAFQRELGRIAVRAGADLVVGHHAHIWQPVELVAGRPVVYGLGNFAFGSGNRRADEALLVRAILRGQRLARLEFFPLYIKNRDALVHYQPKLLKGASADWTLARLRAESAKLGTELRIEVQPERAVLLPPAVVTTIARP